MGKNEQTKGGFFYEKKRKKIGVVDVDGSISRDDGWLRRSRKTNE
jgi:hypothetical protein